MNEGLTVAELKKRWEKALVLTQSAVARHPHAYADLKTLAADIVAHPVDITEYLPTVKRLVELLCLMDPNGQGTIFHLFRDRISPTTIWHVKLLRMECADLLAHLKAFDEWQRQNHRLRVVK